jgi:[ribosomal protein S5]-alanine N-acetyltransferase
MNNGNLQGIITVRLRLCVLDPSHVKIIQDYYSKNKVYFSEFIPFEENFFTSNEIFLKHLWNEFELIINKIALRLYVFELDDVNCTKIIGDISVSNIILGAIRSCQLGYKLDEASIGNGFMTEALKWVIDFLFTELKIHRIEAYIIQANVRSVRLIERLNFKLEGLAEKYIFVNNKWEDHLRYVLINSTE